MQMIPLYILFIALFQISNSQLCKVKTCGANLCHSESFCTFDSRCVCPYGFTTNPNSSEGQECCYEQKKQMLAFFLEFMLFFGAGHFYIGRNVIGISKLVTLILLIIINLAIMPQLIYKRKIKRTCQIFQGIFCVLFALVFLVWQLVDIYFFAKNAYTDENNIELLQW